MKLFKTLTIIALVSQAAPGGAQYIGNYSSNPYAPNSLSNPYGAGNLYSLSSPDNPDGQGLKVFGN